MVRVRYMGLTRIQLEEAFATMKTWEPFLTSLSGRYRPFGPDYKAFDAIHNAIRDAGHHFLVYDSPFSSVADIHPDTHMVGMKPGRKD